MNLKQGDKHVWFIFKKCKIIGRSARAIADSREKVQIEPLKYFKYLNFLITFSNCEIKCSSLSFQTDTFIATKQKNAYEALILSVGKNIKDTWMHLLWIFDGLNFLRSIMTWIIHELVYISQTFILVKSINQDFYCVVLTVWLKD